MKSIADKSV